MDYFDFESVAAKAKIPADKLEAMIDLLRPEFHQDPMMLELHVLRACLAIRDGRLTLDEALAVAPALA